MMSATPKKRINIGVGSKKDFFSRGKEIAKKIDDGEKILPSNSILFEDPKEMIGFLSENKFMLISLLREHPRSISDLVKLVKRNRTSITRDINMLEEYGLVFSEKVTNAGHGTMRLVKTASRNPILLQIII